MLQKLLQQLPMVQECAVLAAMDKARQAMRICNVWDDGRMSLEIWAACHLEEHSRRFKACTSSREHGRRLITAAVNGSSADRALDGLSELLVYGRDDGCDIPAIIVSLTQASTLDDPEGTAPSTKTCRSASNAAPAG